uniref:Williams-Beuren syndrome chromosomal region 16 protein n=1 Tax=Panagrellus redivivus TaxID=6233 RepID=A0A7E4V679_PANRE
MLRGRLTLCTRISARSVSDVPPLDREKPQQDYRNLRTSRAVYGCGLSKSGSLAIPNLVEKRSNPEVVSRPLRISYCNGKKIKKVASGFGFSLFASSNELFGSGLNNFYQLGGPINDQKADRSESYYIGGKKIMLPSDAGKIVDIAAGRLHSLVATTNKVYAFGSNTHGQCGQDPAVHSFVTHDAGHTKLPEVALPDGAVPKKVHCSLDSSFVLLEDGRVFSFGLGADGQLGNGSVEKQFVPKQVAGDVEKEKIVEIGGSGDTLLAASANGELFAWGLSEYGQFKVVTDAIQVDHPRHLPFQLGKVKTVAATGSSCIVSNTDGLVYSWGAQILGFGPQVTSLPKPMLLDPPLFGTATNDDSTIQRVYSSCFSLGAQTVKGNFYVWGINRFGSLGLGHAEDQFFPFQVFVPGSVKSVSLGPDHSLYLLH